jgi:hypothetical protein
MQDYEAHYPAKDPTDDTKIGKWTFSTHKAYQTMCQTVAGTIGHHDTNFGKMH